MDNRGYTARIVKAVNSADSKSSLGVQLGKFCVSKEIPVSDVAEYFGVSRMTVYMWFVGKWVPRKKHTDKILKITGKAKQ